MNLLNFFGLTIMSLFTVSTAMAQNHELSILAGATVPSGQVSVGSFGSVSGGISPSAQVSYAYRVLDNPAGSLYFEVPLSRVSKASVSLDDNGVGASASQWFFTPGLPFKFLSWSRVSPYVTGGAGMGWFDSANVRVLPDVRVSASTGLKPVVAFAGGIEFRATRHLRFRLELRDYVPVGWFMGNRNHLAYSAGIGFAF